MPQYHAATINTDNLLSRWIFYWAVIYCIVRSLIMENGGLIENELPSSVYEFANPTFALLFALTYQTYAFIKIILNVRPFNRFPRILVKFFILTFIFKLFPLYLVVGAPPLNDFLNQIYKQALSGIYAFAAVFLSYFAYITKQGLNIFDIYEDLTDSFIKDDNRLMVYRWAKSTFNL